MKKILAIALAALLVSLLPLAARKAYQKRNRSEATNPCNPCNASHGYNPCNPCKTSASHKQNAGAHMAKALDGKLVKLDKKGKMVETHLSKPDDIDYYVLYFSAHWCPPCRKFTPQFVRQYDMHKKYEVPYRNRFEVIFVSNDRSEDKMDAYMKWAHMKWPALSWDSREDSPEITQYSCPGIPCVVVVDRNGRVLADSYEDGEYLGPEAPMKWLWRRLEDEGPPRPKPVTRGTLRERAQHEIPTARS